MPNNIELIPELHDIGKLIDGKLINKKHNLEDLNIKLDTPTWRGILEHHCSDNFREYPKSYETLLLCLADTLASSVSRIENRIKEKRLSKGVMYNVYKLWKPPKEKLTKPFITSEKDLKSLIEFLSRNPTAEEFFLKFGELLKNRAEDAHYGLNITSLYTHSILTGKFYRILKRAFEKNLKNRSINFNNKKEVCELINKKLPNEWKLTIMKVTLRFPQMFHRLRDLNVFRIREQIINELIEKFPDNILFSTLDYIIVICDNENEILSLIQKHLEKWGFYLDIVVAKSKLHRKSIRPDPSQILGNRQRSIYPNLSEIIYPPICEICQMREGNKVWIDKESGIIEQICDCCYRIRKVGEPHKKLASWKDTWVMWIKISLIFEELVKTLRDLYVKFLSGDVGLKDEEIKEIEKEESIIKPSVVQEFSWDYRDFLYNWCEKLMQSFSEEDIEKINDDLFVVRIDELSSILDTLRMFYKLVKEFFPNFITIGKSPIRIGISVSSEKFPFFEHWRFISNPQNDIDIAIIGKGKLSLKLSQLPELIGWLDSEIPIRYKTQLYKLAKMAEVSEKLTEIELLESGKRLRLPNLDFSSTITLIKILGD